MKEYWMVTYEKTGVWHTLVLDSSPLELVGTYRGLVIVYALSITEDQYRAFWFTDWDTDLQRVKEEYWLITYEKGGERSSVLVSIHPLDFVRAVRQVAIIFATPITKEQYDKAQVNALLFN